MYTPCKAFSVAAKFKLIRRGCETISSSSELITFNFYWQYVSFVLCILHEMHEQIRLSCQRDALIYIKQLTLSLNVQMDSIRAKVFV